MARARRFSRSVFVNMPFDSKGRYRDLLLAYVTGLTGRGFMPRSVLEIPQHVYRLDRLRAMVRRCRSSVHDLSCVAAPAGVPRFNMAFELGLVAARPSARWYVFEEQPFRLQRSLSDVNGHDPLVHGGTARGVIAKLGNVFRKRRRRTTTRELLTLHRDVRRLAARIERDEGSLLGRKAFEDLVVGAQLLAKRRGLI